MRWCIVMMLSKNGSFYQTPKSLYSIRVNQALCVCYSMVDSEVRQPLIHTAIASEFVCYEYAIISIHVLLQKHLQCFSRYVLRRLCNYFAITGECANNWRFLSSSTTLGRIIIVVAPILRVATNIGFIGLDNAIQKHIIIHHSAADSHLHVPCRLTRKV